MGDFRPIFSDKKCESFGQKQPIWGLFWSCQQMQMESKTLIFDRKMLIFGKFNRF